MTAQISNRFVFNGKVYSIIAQEYPLDYSPSIHGIVPCQECIPMGVRHHYGIN